MKRQHLASGAWLMIQMPGVALALVALTCLPPATGVMLLVPISRGADRAVVPLALGAGARMVAPGPWHGSLIVEGKRARLALPMLRAGVAMLAARPPCGPPEKGRG